MFDNLVKKFGGYDYFIARVLLGFLFFSHGAQKILGWFGGIDGNGATVPSLFAFPAGVSGVVELVVGLMILLGLFTRLAAIIGILELLVAYFMVHAPIGLIPIVNQGELALLYVAAFILLALKGNGILSIEKALFKKEH